MRGSRLFLSAFLLFGVSGASTADTPAKEKIDAEESLAQLRAYLPTLRCKALLEEERKSDADLKQLLQLSQAFVEGGLAHQTQAQQVEEELLRGRLRLLQLDAEYHDSLDQFTHRFKIPAERRLEIENAAILPLTKLFRRFEKLSSDSEEIVNSAFELGRDEEIAKVRPGLIKLLTTSTLVMDTSLPKLFRREWAEWEKIKSIKEVSNKLHEMRNQLDDLRREKVKQQTPKNVSEDVPPRPEKSKDSPRKDDRREQDIFLACGVGSFELALRTFEAEQEKEIIKESKERKLNFRNESFRRIIAAFNPLRGFAYCERFERLVRSWPTLPPLRLKEMDLIASEDSKTEETVTGMLKTPDEQVNGRKKLRQLRTLAKSYSLEQRLFVLAFMRRAEIQDAWLTPPSPPAEARSGLIGPILQSSPLPPTDVSHLIGAYHSLSQARRRLLQTWIDYQMVRLDLYGDLGLSPPDR